MTDAREHAAAVHALIGRHQSKGRKTTYALMGIDDIEASASGAIVRGGSGREYLDFGGYAVFLLGHAHPQVVAAVQEQLHRLPGSSRLLPSEINAKAAAAVAGAAPAPLTKVQLLNSGAEAVEAAVKLSRASTGRTDVLYLEHAFHGKTLGALSLTDNEQLRTPFMPLLPGMHRISRYHADEAARAIGALRPAAVICEPIQGEGGVFELAPAFLRALRDACTSAGSLLICDEIQCGLGRTGAMWAFEAADVVPDVLLAGKALGGGVIPVSAMIASEQVFRPFDRDPFIHTSTFGGNPMASAAAYAALRVIADSDVPGLCRAKGERIRGALNELVRRWPHLFGTVTGRGLLLGLHCADAPRAGLFVRAAVSRQLLVTPCIDASHVVRISPSAFVSAAEMDRFEALLPDIAAEVEEEASKL